MSEKKLIDDYFYVEQTRWKMWKSCEKLEEIPLVTSLTEEDCISATRSYLKWKQEGFPDAVGYDIIKNV